MEEKYYIGVCGLYCGLCPRFQSSAESRCPGCHLGEQHNYCSVWKCAQKGDHWTCSECADYACDRLRRAIGEGADSFISHRPAFPNLDRIRQAGLEAVLAEGHERRELVEHLIAHYNEGRSMSFFCVAATLLPPDLVRQAIAELEDAEARGLLDASDRKASAKAMRATLQELADEAGIDLKLRRGAQKN